MKAFLMYRDRDFDLQLPSPANEELLVKDLELDTLFVAMANKDQLVFDVSKKAVLTAAANDVAGIEYRQAALKDCLSNPDVVRQLYGLAVNPRSGRRRYGPHSGSTPQVSPHFQARPKVSEKDAFWRRSSSYRSMRGRSLASGILGMRS